MTLAILCSGQGPQHPQMFALTGDTSEAANLFAHASTLLGGRDPRTMARVDSNEALHQNRVGQILCTLQALAATSILRDAWPRKLIVAGYSVGEVAAWSVAGLLDATTTLDLVSRRAEAMDAASIPGDGLLFVRGLSRGVIEDLCNNYDVAVDIVNPGDAYVLGGAGKALDALAEKAKTIGAARVVRVAVNVASHTSRLAAASAEKSMVPLSLTSRLEWTSWPSRFPTRFSGHLPGGLCGSRSEHFSRTRPGPSAQRNGYGCLSRHPGPQPGRFQLTDGPPHLAGAHYMLKLTVSR
ncbi:acyltransferase domain-containing protein [Tardiphaga robiniae]|uniref:acyltransferase domain-containing protein n=1 Tax=Tardiphaga robiniae TaxID=943830 RepID=UPI00308425AC